MRWTKKTGKSFLVLVLTAFLSTSAISIPAYADIVQKQIQVTYNNIQVTVNGRPVQFVGNNQVLPFNFNGSVYLPLRAITQALGYTVSYDSASNTVNLTSSTNTQSSGTTGTPPTGTPPTGTPPTGTPPTGTPPTGTPPTGTPPTGTPPTGTTAGTSAATNKAEQKLITVAYNNVKIMLNNQLLSLKDSNGNTVDPVNYNGSIYLPVRAFAQALGISVSYDAASNTVIIGSSNKGSAAGDPGGNTGSTSVSGTAAYTYSSGTTNKSQQTLSAAQVDESVIKVSNSAEYTLTDSSISKSGDSSSEESSNFTGLNAAVLAESAGKINLGDCTITTNAAGANAVFATGEGSTINLSNITIKTSKDSSRGLDATLKGSIIANDVDITTAGAHCAAIATDRGGGTIVVTGGTMNTSGEGSPGIYSTGDITVSDADLSATGSEAAVIEGKNSITLNNTTLSGTQKCGIMLYQSFSGDAEVGTSVLQMNGGSLTASVGPLFYATNTDTVIELKAADLNGGSGVLLKAGADRWGTAGSNGATVKLTADSQTLEGSISCDSISSITVILQNNTEYTGAVNTDAKAKTLVLNLDEDSSWTVTGDSYLSSLTDADETLANIHDNGYTIYYDASNSANSWLDGKTITLTDGGKLTPMD